jgi:hypothetical protein
VDHDAPGTDDAKASLGVGLHDRSTLPSAAEARETAEPDLAHGGKSRAGLPPAGDDGAPLPSPPSPVVKEDGGGGAPAAAAANAREHPDDASVKYPPVGGPDVAYGPPGPGLSPHVAKAVLAILDAVVNTDPSELSAVLFESRVGHHDDSPTSDTLDWDADPDHGHEHGPPSDDAPRWSAFDGLRHHDQDQQPDHTAPPDFYDH